MKKIISLLLIISITYFMPSYSKEIIVSENIIADYNFETTANETSFHTNWGGHYGLDDSQAKALISFISEPENAGNRVMQLSTNTKNSYYPMLRFTDMENAGKMEISYRVKYAPDSDRAYDMNITPFAIDTDRGDISLRGDEYGNWDYGFFPCQSDMLADWCEIKAIVDFDLKTVRVFFNGTEYPETLALKNVTTLDRLKFIFANGTDKNVKILFDDFLIRRIVTAQADDPIIIHDDFEDSSVDYSSHWEYSVRSKMSVIEEASGNHILKYQNTSGENWFNYNFDQTSGNVHVTYRIRYAPDSPEKPYGSASSSGPCIFGHDKLSWTIMAWPDQLHSWDLGSLPMSNVLSDWCEVKAILNFDTHTMKVYYNGRLFPATMPFPADGGTPIDSMSSIKFYFSGNSVVYFDDIKVENVPLTEAESVTDLEAVNPKNPITLNFSKEINQASLAGGITIMEGDRVIPNRLEFSLSSDKKALDIKVLGDLKYNISNYSLVISGNLKDISDESVSARSFAMKTISVPSAVPHINGTLQAAPLTSPSVIVTNPGNNPEEVILSAVAYGPQNEMLGVKILKLTLEAYETTTRTSLLITGAEGAEYVRVYILDNNYKALHKWEEIR